MKRKACWHVFVSLMIYVVLLSCYIWGLAENGFFENSVQEIESLLGRTGMSVKVFLIILSILFSIFALLVEYVLSKFLVLLFIEDGIVSVVDVFIAKSITLVIYLGILLIVALPSSPFQFTINMFGILLMYCLTLRRQKNKKVALLFCLPFAIDIFISLLRQ